MTPSENWMLNEVYHMCKEILSLLKDLKTSEVTEETACKTNEEMYANDLP